MDSSTFRLFALGAALLALAGLAPPVGVRAGGTLPDIRVEPRALPEFPHATQEAWINSEPIRLADLKGQVVLIEIWTTA